MNDVGGAALTALQYGTDGRSPATPKDATAMATGNAYQCDLMPQVCARGAGAVSAPRSCSYRYDTDFNGAEGGDLGFVATASALDCCKACVDRHGCKHMTFKPAVARGRLGECYLKVAQGRVVDAPGLVSGSLKGM